MSKRIINIVLYGLLLLPGPLFGNGFWDQGIEVRRAMSQFSNPSHGTSASPLVFNLGACPFQTPFPPIFINLDCAALAPTSNWNTWPQSNFLNVGLAYNPHTGAIQPHWTIIHLNETWAPPHQQNSQNQNPGPPGQSLPVGSLSSTNRILRFGFEPELSNPDWATIVRLQADHRNGLWQTNPIGPSAIPYIAFGAHRGWGGQTGAIMSLQESSSYTDYIQFGAWKEAHTISASDSNSGAVIWLQMFSEWGGKKHMVEFPLFQAGVYTGSGPLGTVWGWNWPIVGSPWFPGWRGVHVDVPAMNAQCNLSHPGQSSVPQFSGANGQFLEYVLDVARIWNCLNDNGSFDPPMPSNATLDGFFIAVEVNGTGSYISTALVDLKTVRQ